MQALSPLPTEAKSGSRIFSASNIVLFLLCLMYLLTYIDRVNDSTASNIFEKELHLDKTQVGFVFSAFAYPYLLFQIIGGYLGDRFGPRKVLTICSLIWAGATILTGLVNGFVAMVVARVLLGFGEGATFPAATSAMSSWTRPADRGFAQGIASCLWVFAWFLVFRDNPAEHSRITQEELSVLPVYTDQAMRRRNPVPWGALFLRMLPVTFVYFCYGWTLWLFLSWLPQYFKNQYSLDLKDSALFAMAVFFAGVIGDALGGVVTDFVLRKTHDLKQARRNLVVVF